MHPHSGAAQNSSNITAEKVIKNRPKLTNRGSNCRWHHNTDDATGHFTQGPQEHPRCTKHLDNSLKDLSTLHLLIALILRLKVASEQKDGLCILFQSNVSFVSDLQEWFRCAVSREAAPHPHSLDQRHRRSASSRSARGWSRWTCRPLQRTPHWARVRVQC